MWVTSYPVSGKSYKVLGFNSATQPNGPIDTLINNEMEKHTKVASVCPLGRWQRVQQT
jgi:hypothetical protein